jgi:peptidoglycan/LPS O-acetylase OafA/YrhL
MFPLFGGYLVLWAGFAQGSPLSAAGRFGDFSYGLYLWGWPAQQIVQSLAAPSHWALNVALAMPLALALAVLSWFAVEKPALAFKSRGRGVPTRSPRRPEAAASP